MIPAVLAADDVDAPDAAKTNAAEDPSEFLQTLETSLQLSQTSERDPAAVVSAQDSAIVHYNFDQASFMASCAIHTCFILKCFELM